MKKPDSKNLVKYILGFLSVIVLRIVPHPPNVEPIMSTMMPYSKRWGPLSGAFFAFISITGFDLLTGTLGIWSFVTASTYTALGFAAGRYFKKRKSTALNYLKFSIIGTLVYDFVTGIGLGVLVFKQDLMVTLLGQIPFTINHLGGNIAFSISVSPLLFWMLKNPKFDTRPFLEMIMAPFRVPSIE
jgi:uncharacterized membrane protein